MITHSKAGEIISITRDGTIVNADIRTPRSTLWLPMKDYKRVGGYATSALLTLGAKLTAQLWQAKDDSGTDAKLLVTGESDGLSTAQEVSVEAGQDEMDGQNGFTHVKLLITTDNAGALLGAGFMARTEAVYKPV
jgi:hypothetical protein